MILRVSIIPENPESQAIWLGYFHFFACQRVGRYPIGPQQHDSPQFPSNAEALGIRWGARRHGRRCHGEGGGTFPEDVVVGGEGLSLTHRIHVW